MNDSFRNVQSTKINVLKIHSFLLYSHKHTINRDINIFSGLQEVQEGFGVLFS